MNRKEKKERFHDALLHMLYPPPQKEVTPAEPPSLSAQHPLNLNFPDEFEPSSSGSDDVQIEYDDGTKKLTRAQRKRLRKKKLKEAASQRREIIGPVLPPIEVDICVTEDQPEGVRQNAPETLDAVIQEPGRSASSCSKPSRANKRRRAKNLSNTKLPGEGNSNEDHIPVDNGK